MRRDIVSASPDITRFTPSSRFNLSSWAINHGGFTAFLLVLLLTAGGYSLLNIGQKEDPDFTFRVMVVQVLWPGATVEETQDQVVDKIERKLQETPGLDFIRSYMRPGFANIFVNLKGSVRGDAVSEAFYQVRKKIGDIRQTLPEGVIGPFCNDEFGDTYISLHAVTGAGFSYPELKTFAKRARDILLRVITLTACAAVLALIPLARDVFWAPMALAMMGGIIAATILTLRFLPALYGLAFRVAVPRRPEAFSASFSFLDSTARIGVRSRAERIHESSETVDDPHLQPYGGCSY
jgi:multidrug efflux pump subunit AcrB